MSNQLSIDFKWWENINPHTHCVYCGNSVRRTAGSITVGMCEKHLKIWHEDIESGFKQNRLRQIMVDRGQINP